MNSVNIESPVGQKLAAASLTKVIRGKFNLYPHSIAKGIVDEAGRGGLDPMEMFVFLESSLPAMVTEFLTETKKIIEKGNGRTGQAKWEKLR